MKRFFFLITAFVFFLNEVNSQTVREVLAATQAAYSAHDNLSMSVMVLNYATASTTSGTLVGKGKMSKSKTGYYSAFMNTELVSNKECTVIVDHDSKEMTFLPAEKKDIRKMDFTSSIDSLSISRDSIVYKGIINGKKLLVLFGNDPYIIKTEIFISNSTSLIDKIVYYYAPDTDEESIESYKVEIIYQNISFSKVEETVFSEGKFIELKNKQWKPVAAYKNYRITVVAKPAL